MGVREKIDSPQAQENSSRTNKRGSKSLRKSRTSDIRTESNVSRSSSKMLMNLLKITVLERSWTVFWKTSLGSLTRKSLISIRNEEIRRRRKDEPGGREHEAGGQPAWFSSLVRKEVWPPRDSK